EAAVTREAVRRARELARHGERAAAEEIDRDDVPRLRDGRTVEARVALELLPRRVTDERVARDLDRDVERVRAGLLVRERERDAPLDAARIMDRAPGPRGPVGRAFHCRRLAAELLRNRHLKFTRPSRTPTANV